MLVWKTVLDKATIERQSSLATLVGCKRRFPKRQELRLDECLTPGGHAKQTNSLDVAALGYRP